MWTYNNDYGKWFSKDDSLKKDDFDFLKQELSATRFYSKFLSGATYIPINNLENIYDVISEWEPKNWYVSTLDSPYTVTSVPNKYAKTIDKKTSYDYYTKFLSEYGMTLKNLFTPDRLIKESLRNYVPVDVATTEAIDITISTNTLFIDGVMLKPGHRVLVKDQATTEFLSNTIDPNEYFTGNYKVLRNLGASVEYFYYNNENGIYLYDGKKLIKVSELDDYEKCIRLSLYVKLGNTNIGKQFHLSRLINGYYPTSLNNEPMEFVEKHNWLLRHRVDYNNLFEINYYDVLKSPTHSYYMNGITYSIPERIVSIGEFGVILNTQNGVSNIMPNKYKVNLRSIEETTQYYWICGDDTTLLKVRKHDFNVERIKIDSLSNLSSISFFDDMRGVVVGELNTILLTTNSGQTWKRLKINDFASFTYKKVIFTSFDRFYVVGRNGVFIEVNQDISGWTAYRRRISKQIDDDDEYLLVENINDISYNKLNNWGLTYSYFDESISNDKEFLFLVTDNSNIIIHDINDSTKFDFLYLDFGSDYGDIKNIVRRESTNQVFFTGKNGLYSFNLNDFTSIGVANSYSNTISGTFATYVSDFYSNEIIDYDGSELVICGNTSLLKSSLYTDPMSFEILDPSFESRLKSKMLFLDYDMGAKLNWFTDSGDYRLPNSITIPADLNSGSTYSLYSFSTDGNYNGPINILDPQYDAYGKNINIARSFMRNPAYESMCDEIRVTLNVNHTFLGDLAINLSHVVYSPSDRKYYTLSLNIKDFDEGGSNNNLSDVTFSTNDNYPSISESSYPYDGKMFRMSKKIGVKSHYNDWYYTTKHTTNFKDFFASYGNWTLNIEDRDAKDVGQLIDWTIEFIRYDTPKLSIKPLINNAMAPSYLTQSETNWWTYWTDREKTFQYYTNVPLDDSKSVLMSGTFSFSNSYAIKYGFEVSNDINSIEKLAPRLNELGTQSSRYSDLGYPQVTISNLPSTSRSDLNNPSKIKMYIYHYLMILDDEYRYGCDDLKVGDVVRLESSIVDVNLVVNKVLSMTRGEGRRKLVYLYTEFNENIVNNLVELSKNGGSITLRNLNLYDTNERLVENFNVHPISNAYGITYSNTNLTISPKFNNLTAYYNLATNFIYNGMYYTMSYTDGFLKFGYTPTYNILDYLESINKNINNPTFYADKEYLAMPVYEGIPLGSMTASNIYIDSNGIRQYGYSNGVYGEQSVSTTNKLLFGSDLFLEWESIFINTFVDVVIDQPSVGRQTAERLLVMGKRKISNIDGLGIDVYEIEFHKNLNFTLNTSLSGGTIDIKSRRKLIQISDDLQEINNIQRGRFSKKMAVDNSDNSFMSYERNLNFKISTDSYAKIMLSDVDTVNELSAIMYVDYKNELAMNITKLDRNYNIPITNTFNRNGYLYIQCFEKHNLGVGDGFVLEFNGGTFSSEYLNQQYFGYHYVTEVTGEYEFVTEVQYGQDVFIGNDVGYVKYLRKDPFLNYQPVDIVDVGLNKKGNVAIQLDVENLKLKDTIFSLENVDFKRYRYRLIDGMTLETITLNYPWLLDAEISDALIGMDNRGSLIWYKGIWESGRWFGGTWISGTWKYGDWYDGIWYSKSVNDNILSAKIDETSYDVSNSTWVTGRWYGGTWNGGMWAGGRWYGGTWNDGQWNNGIWNNGKWNFGRFLGGIWVDGVWNDGVFNTDNEPSFWIDGEWNGGDFENGVWYNGIFGEQTALSRFGTKAYNSRTALWYGGKWKSGSFFSQFNEVPDVSETHKFSIWKSGQWFSGNFYGGVVYNMNFSSGVWHGGILEDIQIIGMNSKNNSFILNGVYRFNIGDEIWVIDNNYDGPFSKFGSNSDPKKYLIMKNDVDMDNKLTEVYVDLDIDLTGLSTYVMPSGDINVSIPDLYTEDIDGNVTSFVVATQNVPYLIEGINDIRVKLNLTSGHIGDLTINLRAPNGNIINLKQYGYGGVKSYMPIYDINDPTKLTDYRTIVAGQNFIDKDQYSSNNILLDTIFSASQSSTISFTASNSPYSWTYEMSKLKKVGDNLYESSVDNWRYLLGSNGVVGDWSLYIQSNHIYSEWIDNSRSRNKLYSVIGENCAIYLVDDQIKTGKIRIGDTITVSPLNVGDFESFDAEIIEAKLVYRYNIAQNIVNFWGTDIINARVVTYLKLSKIGEVEFGYKTNNNPFTSCISANITIKDNPGKLINWELQFVTDNIFGAQIDNPHNNGIDTGLRVVSKFKNANWKSGIWTNGIYDSGVFEGGIWYNGIFSGSWG